MKQLTIALLPILCLIVVALLKNIKTASISAFILTTGIFFYWESSSSIYFASLISAFISTINIIMVVIGALFLFNTMQEAKLIDEIKTSLTSIHPSREIIFFFITISLTAFFEGIAGFGTPGAIVPPILISMGFNPIMSIAGVLLFDGIFAVFGAIGTPIVAGIQDPLNLSEKSIQFIGFYSSICISIVGLAFLFFTFKMYEKSEEPMTEKFKVLIMYFCFAIPLIFFAWFTPELATVLSAATMLASSIIYLTKGKVSFSLKPWIPYLILITLLTLPKISTHIEESLKFNIGINNIMNTEISSEFQPLKSPLLPFLIVAAFVLVTYKNTRVPLKPIIQKVLSVFIILFPIIGVSQMMVNSGSNQPSMISVISDSFMWMDNFYIGISPFIGMMGSFITGTTTVSNIIFSPSQIEIAKTLNLDTSLILALQHSGASIGNAICLFNIVAAASVAGIKEENKILGKTIMPTLAGGIVIGGFGAILIFIFNI